LNGQGNCVFDDNNSGSAQAYTCRVTDYTMAGANNFFTVPSSSTTRTWNSDSSIFDVTYSLGSAAAFFSLTPGTPPTLAHKGAASQDKNGLGFGAGISWSANTHNLFYGAGGLGNFPIRQTLNSYVLDTTQTTWNSAAITGTVLLDPINCTGLTAYNTGTLGPYWNRWLAATSSDQNADKLDHVSAADYRYKQDVGSLIVVYDSTQTAPGCRWIDLKTGQVGGSYGPTGATTGFGPLRPPAAPVVTATSGSLPCGHTYAIRTTYVVRGNNAISSGESTPSATTTFVPSGSGNTCGLSVTPPTANPGGISLSLTATGFNTYACDRTASPGCTVTMQSNGTNSLGALAQPVINPTVSGCTVGSTTYTYYLVAKNGDGLSTGGASATSASVTVNNVADHSPNCTVSWTAVSNATGYDVLRDNVTILGCSATAPATSCVDTNNFPSNYANQTTPIGTTPAITSLVTTSPVPPTVNGAGVQIHNFRLDESGQWIVFTTSDAFSNTQGSPANAPMEFVWHISTNKLIPANPGAQTCPYLSYGAAHWTHGYGTMISWPGSTELAEGVMTTLNDSCAIMTANQVFMNVANGGLDTQTGDQHLSHSNSINSVPDTPIFRDAYPITTPYVLPSAPYDGELTAWQTPVSISAISRSSGTVTVTTSTVHNLSVGAEISILDVTNPDNSFNGTFPVASTPTTTTFTYLQSGTNRSSSVGTGSVDRPMLRFCHTWASGAQGFNSTPRGSVSQDGSWFIFESDMQRNANGSQGTASVGLGSNTGGTSCTLGSTCRFDVFLCQLK
jgi:hypothetical protein